MTATKAAVARAEKASKISQARAANRAERHARRDEIVERWSDRRLFRSFAEHTRDKGIDEAFNSLMVYGKELSRLELLWAADFPKPNLELLVSKLCRIIELKEMPYDEYLQSPEWQERAARAKRRYHGACALDDTHSAEHAHHRTYERRGREWDTDLVPLCADCHARFHGKTPR